MGTDKTIPDWRLQISESERGGAVRTTGGCGRAFPLRERRTTARRGRDAWRYICPQRCSNPELVDSNGIMESVPLESLLGR